MQSTRLAFVLLLLAAASVSGGKAQFGPFSAGEYIPQAETPKELDAYLEIAVENDPARRILKVNEFLSGYPDSNMKGAVRLYEMAAHEERNDAEGVLRAGRDVLIYLPGNLRALLSLASAIPNMVSEADNPPLLLQAEEHARRALEVLGEKRIPPGLPLQEWEMERDRLAAQAHEALGHIAVKRGDLDLAIDELRRAVEQNPAPEGRQFFRLGMVHGLKGNAEPARAALLRAAELGPDLIRERSREELAKLPSPAAQPGGQ